MGFANLDESIEMFINESKLESKAIVFVVDDGVSMRESLENLIRSVGLRVEVFAYSYLGDGGNYVLAKAFSSNSGSLLAM
jgi:FixJ family two-component response regulator